MIILVINAGSSSLKYQLIDMEREKVIAKGNCERIGNGGVITHKTEDFTDSHEMDFATHAEAFLELVRMLSSGEHAVIESMGEITAVGHRIVQGGEKFRESILITDSMLSELEKINDLAPLHNPAHIVAIRACQKVLDKSIPQVAVFDTAFHQSIPKKAYIYPIPYEYYEKYAIRRYGFHGTSHRYVSGRLSEIMGKPLSEIKAVTCHLGNGSSISAIDGGCSVDTTMGFTPLDGMIMGTRSGAVDPSIITFLEEKEGLCAGEMVDLLNKKSGYLGVSGTTSDQRDLFASAEGGNERAQLALDIQHYQIKKYIGAFAAAMGGIDAIVFTGGIGENSAPTRQHSCSNLEFMGIKIDSEVNSSTRGEDKLISTADSKVKVYVIPTNEELLIARDTRKIVETL